jgi:hypothetical protein
MTRKTRMIPQTMPALNIPSTTAHPDKLNVKIPSADRITVCFFMDSIFLAYRKGTNFIPGNKLSVTLCLQWFYCKERKNNEEIVPQGKDKFGLPMFKE